MVATVSRPTWQELEQSLRGYYKYGVARVGNESYNALVIDTIQLVSEH